MVGLGLIKIVQPVGKKSVVVGHDRVGFLRIVVIGLYDHTLHISAIGTEPIDQFGTPPIPSLFEIHMETGMLFYEFE